MLHKRIGSFKFALAGLRLAWREEMNFRVEVILGASAVAAGLFFGISTTEWLFVAAACAAVLTAEAFNTSLEELCDMLRQTHDPHVAKIKDVAAAAVLISSIGALVIGLVIFVPRVLALL